MATNILYMKPNKAKVTDFIVLSLTWYLAYWMADYGYHKMVGEQFSVDNRVLDLPMRNVNKFYMAWRLFSMSKVFDISVGIVQIIGVILIVINRTRLIGALILLPVLCQIFLIDLSFTAEVHGPGLYLRLAGMIVSDVLIMVYYRERMMKVWYQLTDGVTTRFRYKWWTIIGMPLVGFGMDFVWAIVLLPFKYIIYWLTA